MPVTQSSPFIQRGAAITVSTPQQVVQKTGRGQRKRSKDLKTRQFPVRHVAMQIYMYPISYTFSTYH